jgi:hypothetical protein
MKKLLWLVSGLLFGLVGVGRAAGGSAALAENGFIDETILGWHVKVGAEFWRSDPLVVQEALVLLHKELEAITTAIPAQRLAQLRQVTFWLDERVPEGGESAKGPVFHPDRNWLKDHDLNPDMAGGIELPNALTFLDSYSWEPWVIMHELAHFYHHTVLGDGNALVRDAYRHARETHLYESVRHYDGRTLRAYALENEKEYFAELTEAYFGRNDFYPFTRDELQSYDPAGFAMMQEVWEAP